MEPKSPKPLIFRKIRPKYKKALIPFLIVGFIVAVVLLIVFYRYYFRPVFEKKGSIETSHTAVVENSKKAFEVQGLRFKAPTLSFKPIT